MPTIITDIIFIESDSEILEVAGSNMPATDVLFDNSEISEITGANGVANDIVFDPATTNEIPNAGYPKSRVVNQNT